MKIRNQISFIVLPLIIVPLILTAAASSFSARNGITEVTADLLQFKAEELRSYAENQWTLLVENNLASEDDFVAAAKSSVGSFARGLVRNETERIFAVDGNGTMVMATNEIAFTEEETEVLIRIIRNESFGWQVLQAEGVTRVAHVLPFEPFGWYIFITQNESVFYSSINQIYLRTGIIMLVFLVLAVVLLIIFTGHFTKPLRDVAGAMREVIETNDLSKKVEILYHDETGDLGHAFNLMTEELQNAYDQIKIYALETAISRKQEEKIRHIFQKYVPKEVIDRFIGTPESMLSGEDRMLAVLFSDIRRFTTISERMKPKDIVESLNKYFGTMVSIIMNNNGIVDKYIGDAIMAFYGAPVSHKEDAFNAVQSAFEMLDALEEFNLRQRRLNAPEFNIGIGINYGLVTVGNIGSEQKMEYTVIGDMVNLASRLEGLTKIYDEQLIFAEGVYREVIRRVPCRMIDRVAVKGRSIGMGIYTAKRTLSPEEETAWKFHHAGLISYYNRYFEEAVSYFTKVQELLPEDMLSNMFIRRCEELIRTPPGNEWDGIVTLTEK